MSVLTDGINSLGDLIGGSTTQQTTTTTTQAPVQAPAAPKSNALLYIGIAAGSLALIGIVIWLITGNSKGGGKGG